MSAETTSTDDRLRRESFRASGPLKVRIHARSGDVHVETATTGEVQVNLAVARVQRGASLDEAVVEFDADRGSLEVWTRPRESFDLGKRLNAALKRKSWMDVGRFEPDVAVVVPEGSTVEVSSASGDVQVGGTVETVTIASASGDVCVGEVATLEVRTASGDVKASCVRDRLLCHSASGDVRCDAARGSIEVRTASGDVTIGVAARADVGVRTVSGDVTVRVSRGLLVDVDASSVSGDLKSTIPLGSKGEESADGDLVTLSVKTIAGDVRISSGS